MWPNPTKVNEAGNYIPLLVEGTEESQGKGHDAEEGEELVTMIPSTMLPTKGK